MNSRDNYVIMVNLTNTDLAINWVKIRELHAVQCQSLLTMAVKFLLAFLFTAFVIESSYGAAECPHPTFVAKHVSKNNIEPSQAVAAVEAATKKRK